MTYADALEKVNESLHLVDRYLDENGGLVEEPTRTNLIIREVIVAPNGDSMGLFKTRYEDSLEFEKAIAPWMHRSDLQVNLWVENLDSNKFGFYPLPE